MFACPRGYQLLELFPPRDSSGVNRAARVNIRLGGGGVTLSATPGDLWARRRKALAKPVFRANMAGVGESRSGCFIPLAYGFSLDAFIAGK